MKKQLLLFLIIPFSFLSNAQNFQKYYDRDLGTNAIGELGHGIIQTADGGYLAVGYSDNYGIGQKDVYAVRLDQNGDTLWTKLYGNAGGNDMARAVVQTADGGFAIAGETQSGAGLIDAVIFKIDSVGNLLWSKAFGGSKDELAHSLIEMGDESLILAGLAVSYSANNYDEIFLVKVDKDGNLIWAKTLNGGSGELARSIANTSDGGFIISGDENSLNYGVFMVKFTANADTSWSRTYRAGYSSYSGYGVSQTSDGGYIMAANTYGGSIGSVDMIALKVSSTGAVNWTKEIGTLNTELATDIIQTSDGGYVISGTAMPGGSFYEMVLAKLNASGTLLWSKNMSGNYGTNYAMDNRYQVVETSDNGLVAIGNVYNNFINSPASYSNGWDMMIVKTDSAGEGTTASCVRNANLQSASATWTAYNSPFDVTSVIPTVTNGVFIQKYSAGNYGNIEIRINFSTTAVTCGLCDGSATANPCDSSGYYCSGANPWSYQWSNAQTSAAVTGLCFGTYTVTVSDYTGCRGVDTVFVSTGALPQEICLVTVDPSSTKNVVVWEKPAATNIDSFRVYREIGLNNFVIVGAVAYEELSLFTDATQGINPNTTSYRYKISTLDNCGNESLLSSHHRTIHLSTPQFTPPKTFDLIWTNDYEGFSISQYYILRDLYSTGNWTIIDSVTYGNNSYTDSNSDSAASYIVEAVHPGGPCVATKSAENHNSSRSNKTYPISAPGSIKDAVIADRGFLIFPNPNTGSFSVQLAQNMVKEDAELCIFNILGEKIFQTAVNNQILDINLLSIKGILYVQLSSGEKISRELLVVQ